MKTKKSIALLLCLLLTLTLFVPSSTAFAVEGDGSTDNGMKVSKTATANADGSYTITLEAYATRNKVISEVKKDIPTDIVLVLDQSGSMDEDIGMVSYSAYSQYRSRNSDHYDRRHNGGSANLWYKVENEDKYYSVSVTLEQEKTYTVITNGRNDSTNNGATNYWDNRNNLYAKVNGEYQKVTVFRTEWYGTYTYTLPNGTVIGTEEGYRGIPKFTGIDDNVLYLAIVNEDNNKYTYTYTDENGATQTIGTSTGANNMFTTTLYQRSVSTSGGGSRLKALKTAVTTFANSVAEKAEGADGVLGTEDDINHRIAVVGFASGNPSSTLYLNSEVFVGANQYQYNTTASQHYAEAFQNMNEVAGKNNVAASIKALDANGATYTNLGVEMANGILNANQIENGTKRNRVVVVFTDGIPGRTGWDTNVAESAISQSNTAKQIYGATVYTVGIFSGADATSAGSNANNASEVQKANWFMQNLSSNNGTPQTPSYYLSAADASTLNNIFKQISDQIESGGSSTTLTEEAVVKDIIAPQFTLPAGATAANITLETYSYKGENNWKKNDDAMGATATVNVNENTVSVTGFDFSDNWCGTVTENGTPTYHGNKLVISFTVSPKADFLGGNNVFTNTSAGVYADSNATEPVKTFNRPQVNVPIKAITVTAADKNVYLLGSLTAEQLKSGATVKVGDVPLNLAAENYGLESWQTEFVDIEVLFKDQGGNIRDFSYFSSLDEDEQYYIYVIVSPKDAAQETSNGDPATPQNGERIANINVFMPEMTFKDGEIGYLENLPTDFGAHRVPYTEGETDYVQWVHTEAGENGTRTISKNVTMQGDEPTITLEYEAVSGVTDGKVTNSKVVPIDVTAKIGGTDVTAHVTFAHKACTLVPSCEWSDHERTEKFLLHVRTGELTIYKSGMYDHVYTSGSDVDHESAIFTITGPDGTTWQVTIPNGQSVTLTNLQPGEYTVTEVSTWSWRYGTVEEKKVVMSGSSNSETGYNCLSIVNEQNNPYWLGGDNYCVNEFGIVGQDASGN